MRGSSAHSGQKPTAASGVPQATVIICEPLNRCVTTPGACPQVAQSHVSHKYSKSKSGRDQGHKAILELFQLYEQLAYFEAILKHGLTRFVEERT